MNIQVLKNLLAFLTRVQLQGSEVDAFHDARRMVMSMIQAAEAIQTVPHSTEA
jgi:hypothetical protein